MSRSPSVVEVLEHLGGVATRATLVRHTSRSDFDRAVSGGDVVRLAQGRYALPTVERSVAAAHRLGGVLCLTDAATWHGWAVKRADRSVVDVCLPKATRLPAGTRAGDVVVHRANLERHEIDDVATSVEVTLRQCSRQLPFDEALCVADSALRAGVPSSLLRRLADEAVGPGARRLRRVADEATPLAANPFESVARAIGIDVPGLELTPQVWVTPTARADLVDERLRIVVEADSFAWHGSRDALKRDARRYNLMVVEGWIVLRFSWEDVMHDPDYVREVLLRAVALAELQTERAGRRRRRAHIGA